jgi:hypothetical protein
MVHGDGSIAGSSGVSTAAGIGNSSGASAPGIRDTSGASAADTGYSSDASATGIRESSGVSTAHSDSKPKAAALWSLVETAGGVFSPLNPTATNLSLAVALEPAIWIVVAPDALGVLHDLTATLTAMRANARMPEFVVLSAAREPDASTGTNADELARLGIATPVAVLGRESGAALGRGTTSNLADLVDRLANHF